MSVVYSTSFYARLWRVGSFSTYYTYARYGEIVAIGSRFATGQISHRKLLSLYPIRRSYFEQKRDQHPGTSGNSIFRETKKEEEARGFCDEKDASERKTPLQTWSFQISRKVKEIFNIGRKTNSLVN